MFDKILIANRGEIAVRIIRACREMGIKTVAVYSEADRDSLHTLLADEAICIGPAPSSQSYLSMENIISATIVTGADAIHPGFGFLSENSRFAELCEQCNITFIGPPSTVIASLGNKQAAKNTMANAGVPIIPGGKNPIYTVEEGQKEAESIGYPVIIKAALGGGGKGPDVLVGDLDVGNAGVVFHKLPERLLAVPEWGIFLVILHICQHLLHGLLQELGGHFAGLHT